MFDTMQISMRGTDSNGRKNPLDALVELPEDLEAWVLDNAALTS